VQPPVTGHSWFAVSEAVLPITEVYEWCVQPDCGAVVLFSGTVRDHAVAADGSTRPDVRSLTFEAYDEQVVPAFARIADELRRRWPTAVRVAILHRIGRLELSDSSVVVAVSSPHRPEAFEAARFAIDALKSSAPIWKHEVWATGSDWGTGAHALTDPKTVPSAGTVKT